MNNSVGQFFLRRRWPLAIIAGLILAAAFPKIGIAGFAWIAPALMLAAALGQSGGEAFHIGYVAGLAYYLTSLYWLLLIPYRWHSIPLGPAAGWLALGAYVALYPAVWVWLASEGQSPAGTLPNSWTARTVWAISGATAWVALEMVVARLFSGFPWNLLGASQYQITPLLQIASFTGIYGVSFLVVWLSLSLLSAALMLVRRPASRSIWVTEIFVPMAVLAVVFHFGYRRLTHAPPPSRTLRVTFVQPSIPQTLIWDESKDDERFRELLQLSEQALTNQTDLLLWPEAGIPKLLRYDQATFDAVTGLARNHHVWLMVGADDMTLGPDGKPREFYNSSFLISPGGKLVNAYKKRNLVIFGEYIPLVRWVPFMKWFTPIPAGFTAGERAVAFELGDLKVKTSPLICFEDMFPQLARDCTEDDTDFLVNMTNDGWFGESAEPWQHAATAVFRAVENGRPLLRCTNTGLTCWIDARGSLRQIFQDSRGSVYGPGFMTAEIPLLATGERPSRTFYSLHGDWFGWACVGMTALTLLRKLAGKIQAHNR